MPRITCLHGHDIELAVEQFGQRVACPTCQLLITVSPPRPGEPLVPKYEVFCENGHVLRVKSKYLGTQIRCPQCQALALVTTDRLQRHTVTTNNEPIVAALQEQAPVPRRVMPATAPTPIVTPVVNIPVAEVDETYVKPAKRRVNDDDDDVEEEEDAGELTKAERRNLKLVDQGLGYWLGGVVGFCSIYLVATILSFFLSLISQGISTMDGHRFFGTISEIVGWIVTIAMFLNLLLYLGGKVLTLFTPWATGATIWFVLSMVVTAGFIGFRIFLMAREGNWTAIPMAFSLFATLLAGKLYYLISESLFLIMWLLMLMGLWQLAKFVRKPMIRQRVMLMGLMGLGCWVVLVFFPLISQIFPANSKVAFWILVTFKFLLTLGIGALMIFQHLSVVNEVRSVMHRRK